MGGEEIFTKANRAETNCELCTKGTDQPVDRSTLPTWRSIGDMMLLFSKNYYTLNVWRKIYEENGKIFYKHYKFSQRLFLYLFNKLKYTWVSIYTLHVGILMFVHCLEGSSSRMDDARPPSSKDLLHLFSSLDARSIIHCCISSHDPYDACGVYTNTVRKWK